ncbi:MAG: hypothetical protein DRJ13_08710, partial [Bacteroidetes bacterium]
FTGFQRFPCLQNQFLLLFLPELLEMLKSNFKQLIVGHLKIIIWIGIEKGRKPFTGLSKGT